MLLALFFLPLGGKWKCDTCMLQNDSDKEACVACMTKKPANAAAAGTAASKPAPITSDWGGLMNPTIQGT